MMGKPKAVLGANSFLFRKKSKRKKLCEMRKNIHTPNHLCVIHNALFPWAIHSTCSVDLIPCIIVFDTKKKQHKEEKQSCFFITPEAFEITDYIDFSPENHIYAFRLHITMQNCVHCTMYSWTVFYTRCLFCFAIVYKSSKSHAHWSSPWARN